MIIDLPDTTTRDLNKRLVEERDEGGVVALGRVLTLVIGSWHIARHRRDRLAIPYGVAIAAGGLWVLVANYLDPARATFGASLG